MREASCRYAHQSKAPATVKPRQMLGNCVKVQCATVHATGAISRRALLRCEISMADRGVAGGCKSHERTGSRGRQVEITESEFLSGSSRRPCNLHRAAATPLEVRQKLAVSVRCRIHRRSGWNDAGRYQRQGNYSRGKLLLGLPFPTNSRAFNFTEARATSVGSGWSGEVRKSETERKTCIQKKNESAKHPPGSFLGQHGTGPSGVARRAHFSGGRALLTLSGGRPCVSAAREAVEQR